MNGVASEDFVTWMPISPQTGIGLAPPTIVSSGAEMAECLRRLGSDATTAEVRIPKLGVAYVCVDDDLAFLLLVSSSRAQGDRLLVNECRAANEHFDLLHTFLFGTDPTEVRTGFCLTRQEASDALRGLGFGTPALKNLRWFDTESESFE